MLNIEIIERRNNYAILEIDGQRKVLFEDREEDDFVLRDEDEVVFCEECGMALSEDDGDILWINDDSPFCDEGCARDAGYVQCYDCGEWIYEDNAVWYDDVDWPTCDDCGYDRYYCDGCGCHFYYGDNVHYCECDDCYYCDNCDNSPTTLASYHNSQYNGYEIHILEGEDNPRTYGEEVEVEKDDSCDYGYYTDKCVCECRRMFGEFIRHEYDGSLEYGFENIFEPASLGYLQSKKDKIAQYFDTLKNNDFLGDSSYNGGMHVHIGRAGFKDQYRALVNMHLLFEKYWEEIVEFSNREDSEIRSWAKPYDNGEKYEWNSDLEFEASIEEMVADNLGEKKYRLNRYHAINLTNKDTIEIRIFKSTLDIERFFSILKWIDNLCEICDNTPVAEIGNVTWEDIMKDVLPEAPVEEAEDIKEAI